MKKSLSLLLVLSLLFGLLQIGSLQIYAESSNNDLMYSLGYG